MIWKCVVCNAQSSTNRRTCPKCGNIRWRPAPKTDLRELEGPMKRVSPRGLLLARPGKQAVGGPDGIECGTCHVVIYKAKDVFEASAFVAARKKHYSVSPTCERRK